MMLSIVRTFFTFIILGNALIFAQSSKCNLEKSDLEMFRVDDADLRCIARNSEKKNTIFYVFGIWCKPCIDGIPKALGIELGYEADIYVLLIDKEDSNVVERTHYFFSEYEKKYNLPKTKLAILKDSKNSNTRKRKYREFLESITPPNYENIDDMSKYIVLDNTGEVLMVTNWKDSKDDPDDRAMLGKLVLPLLQKKNSDN